MYKNIANATYKYWHFKVKTNTNQTKTSNTLLHPETTRPETAILNTRYFCEKITEVKVHVLPWKEQGDIVHLSTQAS